MRKASAVAIASFCALTFGGAARSLTVTGQDCREGAEFIGNAARSRDNGMTGAQFVARLDEDLVLIQSVKPELRWFARDDDDARVLRAAVLRVFDAPALPDAHSATFLNECMALVPQARR